MSFPPINYDIFQNRNHVLFIFASPVPKIKQVLMLNECVQMMMTGFLNCKLEKRNILTNSNVTNNVQKNTQIYVTVAVSS